MRRLVTFVCAAATALAPALAAATYSIAATDKASRQVGGAVTSCVGSLDVGVVFGSSPGHGVVHAQAVLDSAARGKNKALSLLAMDVAPADIITMITSTSVDPSPQSRQYGVVDVQQRAAGFTGSGAMAYKEDRQGTVATFAYSVQGNILTGKKVIDQAETGFKAGGCDLADRLMAALEAGAVGGEGDSRCTQPKMIPSDSAFIEVDEATGVVGSYLKLSVSGTGAQSPLPMLRTMFDDWRKTHPCVPVGGGDAGSGGDGGAGGIDGGTGDGTADAGQGGQGGSGGGGGASGDGPGAGGGGGCGCRLGGGAGAPVSAIVLALLAAAAIGRRRRV